MKKIGIVGAGKWGMNLVRTFRDLGELAAVAEMNEELRLQLKALYPELTVYDSVQPLLQSEVEGVVIATPVQTHYQIARETLLAGKDVFVEKPITLSVDEASELDQLAQAKQRILMVGHLLLYQPAVQWIKQYVQEGNLGELYSLHQYRKQLGRIRTVENVLWSLGVHDIAVLLAIIGTTPERIMASGHAMLQPQIEDEVHLHLRFPKGIQAHLHMSWLWPVRERRTILIGSAGMLEYDEQKQTVIKHRKYVDGALTIQDEGSELVFRGDQEPLTREALHFLECMANRTPPQSDGKNGMAVIRVLSEATRLLQKGGEV
ncbi:Gfo/Idh/MocA family protein [Brevibacillus fulvus]|uniref:Dehydrogenase n=1 Tax=Brevibacillus fulvus TaxID=1125967 RepID=A0A938Y204_9BACL|nr:Gfo/Idh/MocA family oxidoreductase [Brevibacillus fulvus]MBM7589720.1 putative dehydrogenase [Brevibacillus fulvus]